MSVDRIQFVVFDTTSGIILRVGTGSTADAWAQADRETQWSVKCCARDSVNANDVTDGFTSIDSLEGVEWLEA